MSWKLYAKLVRTHPLEWSLVFLVERAIIKTWRDSTSAENAVLNKQLRLKGLRVLHNVQVLKLMKAFVQKGRISVFGPIFIFCRYTVIVGRGICFDTKHVVPLLFWSICTLFTRNNVYALFARRPSDDTPHNYALYQLRRIIIFSSWESCNDITVCWLKCIQDVSCLPSALHLKRNPAKNASNGLWLSSIPYSEEKQVYFLYGAYTKVKLRPCFTGFVATELVMWLL